MRDHRDEHPGCKVMWPWLRWCSNYRYASQLVGYALEDVKTMEPELFASIFENCKRYDDQLRYRSSARSSYIAHREKSHEGEYQYRREEVARFYEYFPLGHDLYEGRDYEQEVAHQWMRTQQVEAVQVLYAYGILNKKTGQIELDNLKKLK